MTLFEYLAAAYVLLLSFAVVRAISGVAHALRPPRFNAALAISFHVLLVVMFLSPLTQPDSAFREVVRPG